MVEVSKIDVSGLQSVITGLQNAFIGTGRDGDASRVTADESRHLAMEIASGINPSHGRDRSKLEKRVTGAVRRVLYPEPPEPFKGAKAGYDNVRWLAAGPHFLAGVPTQFDWPEISTPEAYKVMHESRNKLPKAKFKDAGKRGRQHVMLLQRMLVSKRSFAGVTKLAISHIGRLGASFAETAKKLGEKRIPSMWARHFPTPKNIHNESGLADARNPSMTFGSRAPSVMTNFGGLVQTAIERRRYKVNARIKKILFGYANDVRERRPIRRRAKETDHA